jgi:site-specific DNA-methyltransferase (adenine-specific)
MDMMARYPDKHFDLAIVDPPYGIGADWKKRHWKKYHGLKFPNTTYNNNSRPGPAYFNELKRVSKEQIIFGYNYFVDILGPTNYLIIWDKMSIDNDIFCYSQVEIAYTSIHKPAQLISIPWDGYRMGKETGTKKIHPHQKPIELYKKLLQKYTKPGWLILDTHLGSASSAIACYDLGFDLTASEIDVYHYETAMKRIKEYQKQYLFDFANAKNLINDM